MAVYAINKKSKIKCMIASTYQAVSGAGVGGMKALDGQVEYLELQHPTQNGWHELNDEELENRFGCQTHPFYNLSNYLIEVDSLTKNNEFLGLLGYINTNEYDQMKGSDGNVK